MVTARKRIWWLFLEQNILNVGVIQRKFEKALVLKYLGLAFAAHIRTKLAI